METTKDIRELKKSHRLKLKSISKEHSSATALLVSSHKKEINTLKKQVNSRMVQLQKRERKVDLAIEQWNQKVEEAENFLNVAQQSIKQQQFEKQDIMKKMARHLARETGEVNELLNQLYSNRIDTVKNHQLSLQKKVS